MPGVSCGPILVADEDERFRSFVVGVFERAGYRARGLRTGDSTLTAAAAEQPAAVLLDVRLPGLNGYEVCRQLRDAYGDHVPVVFVSGERTEPFDRAGGLLVGADDYLVKPVDPGELIARVRRLIRRPQLGGAGARAAGSLASLTRREREVLDLLSSGDRQDAIAQRLVISPRTVATHIQRILKKLDVHSRAQAVAIALRERSTSPSD